MRSVSGLVYSIALASGCSMYTSTLHNAVNEPCLAVDESLNCIRNRFVAAHEWKVVKENSDKQEYSKDYELGFKRGMCDYIAYGGLRSPPPIPPNRYWHTSHQSLDGIAEANEWFAGYRHGTAVAIERGYRQLNVTPNTGAGLIDHSGIAPSAPPSTTPTEQAPTTVLPMPGQTPPGPR